MCHKLNPREGLLMAVQAGRIPSKDTAKERENAGLVPVAAVLQGLSVAQQASMDLFKYFAASAMLCSHEDQSADSTDRDSKLALLTRLEREFLEDESVPTVSALVICGVKISVKRGRGRGTGTGTPQSKSNVRAPLMEVFRREWHRVKSHAT